MSARDEFRAAMAAAGLTPPANIIPYRGKVERFSSSGKPRDDAGRYTFYEDERPAGWFMCLRSGVEVTWRADAKREWTAEEKRAWKEKMRQVEADRRAEEQELRAAAAKKAADMLARGTPANGHAYLASKGITGIDTSALELDGELVLPMRSGPKDVVGVQRIFWDDSTNKFEKRFLYGQEKKGCYYRIGSPADDQPIAIVEGYATGRSVHEATGWCVIVAFDAGNLEPVAKKIRDALPDAQLIIAADDDVFTPSGNTGRAAAAQAARAVNAIVRLPIWCYERGTGTDFNDLHQAEGLEAVRNCLEVIDVIDELVVHEPQAIALPRLVDYIAPLPDATDKGKPLSTIENVHAICQRLGVTVRYNVISKDEEILIPGEGYSVDNRQNASFAKLTSECAKFRMPTEKLGDFVTYLADANQYNPVANWIDSKPWDGVDRLSQLIATVTAEGEGENPDIATMKATLITKWMISAIAAAYRPNGVSAHGVLVFQGDQYIGKTKWFKTLVPAELGVLQDGVILKPEDRDSVKQCCSNWLVELGELDATFRKSDIAALKAFLTKDRDVLRRAYARKESEFARRTVFFASVNPTEFLHDPTGNRRYWTIPCEKLDHSHAIDMQQCWAQVANMYRCGATWFLDHDEITDLNESNKDFQVIDPIEELLSHKLNWKAPRMEWKWLPASEVLRVLGRDTPSQSESTRAAHVIRERNGKQSKKANGVRALLVPPAFDAFNRP